MVSQKSLDQELLKLLGLQAALFSDIAKHHLHLSSELHKDFSTVLRRSHSEGVSFMTQTMPKLAKAIYRSLETQVFVCPTSFRRRTGTALPRFLGGLLKCVYNDDGTLKVIEDSSALVDALQILQVFYKLELPYSPAKENAVIEAFKKTEEDLNALKITDDDFVAEAADFVERILQGFDPMEIIPKHGPGAVATRERALEKWTFKRKYACIHRVYPYYEYFVPSRMSLLRGIPRYRGLESRDTGTARVVLVPKDSRGPRLISMEPLEFQYIQQGIARSLVRHLERRCSITRGKLNFTDQEVNRALALHNSCTRSYATLDMKEASDRVSLELVRMLFRKRPDVLAALEATRTSSTELPDGTILSLRKFAPMGSALCFPVEALCFFALCETMRRREGIRGTTYVYGDDLIVPRSTVPHLFERMPKFGLKFNEDKCFVNGYFRESCGLDAYKGNICTPVRMKKRFPTSRKQASQIVSLVELSNNLFQRGYWKAAEYVHDVSRDFVNVCTLRSPKQSFGGLSFVAFTIKGVTTEGKVRFNKDLQSFEAKVPCTRIAYEKGNSADNEGRLLKNLLGRHREGWERIEVPQTSTIKLRWCSI